MKRANFYFYVIGVVLLFGWVFYHEIIVLIGYEPSTWVDRLLLFTGAMYLYIYMQESIGVKVDSIKK
jgi:hypothetical protein